METEKEIKRKIRGLKKIKKTVKVGTRVRRDINKEIRKLKKQLELVCKCDDSEKLELIEKIQGIYKHYGNLTKFTKEQLQKHLDIIIRKGKKENGNQVNTSN